MHYSMCQCQTEMLSVCSFVFPQVIRQETICPCKLWMDNVKEDSVIMRLSQPAAIIDLPRTEADGGLL